MLAKLIKLDLRFAYKQFLIMAGLLLAFGLTLPYMGQSVLETGAAVVFSVTMTVVPLMCIWLVVQHFQRNLFGAEGYLMFTLPVTAWQLLLSKLVTTVIWFNLMLGSAGGVVLLLLRPKIPAGMIEQALRWDVIQGLLHGMLSININVIPIIMAIFMGISLSTVAVRNRRLGLIWGIAASFGAVGLFSWTSLRLSGWNFLKLTVDSSLVVKGLAASTPLVAELINFAVAGACTLLFFSITSYLVKRKLNLE